jgi:hypothetical protein
MHFPFIWASFFKHYASETLQVIIDAEVVGLVIGTIDGDFIRI